MGQTRVDLLHLLEDLRDAYRGSLEETLLTEIVANSLDSGARRIVVATDAAQSALAISDDGSGMTRRELARYHDIASSRKVRGEGIGFAGVGIKLGLLASEEVLTETKQGRSCVATRWHLASRQRAPWKWVPPGGLVGERGTAVCLKLRNPLSPLLDSGFLESTLARHFEPLLDNRFAEVLLPHYADGVSFVVNGRPLEQDGLSSLETAPVSVRLARKRRPSAWGVLWRAAPEDVLPEERRGVAISTFGKVIHRGWDWLGVFPGEPERVGGLIEAPPLAQCLTLNKNDFVRSGQKGALYLSFRKALQQAVAAQLAAWGDGAAPGPARKKSLRPLEKDLEAVLTDLASDFPLLDTLVERHAAGQRRLPIRAEPAAGIPSLDLVAGGGEERAETVSAVAPGEPPGPEEPPPPPAPAPSETPGTPAGGPSTAGSALLSRGGRGPRKPARFGLKIQFERRPDSNELGRLEESTVFVNQAHPAYQRAAASRSEGYHVALAAAMALAEVAVEPAGERPFLTAFLARWGKALEGNLPSGSRGASPRRRR